MTTLASTWTGAATNAKSASPTAASRLGHASMIAPRVERGLERTRGRVPPAHVRAEALTSREADRTTDQPDTDDGNLHAAALNTLPATAAARSTCSR